MGCFEYRFGSQIWRVLAGLCLILGFAGCPDYSHQAPVPDYSNMTDEGAEPAERETSE